MQTKASRSQILTAWKVKQKNVFWGGKHATTDPADHLGRRNPSHRRKKIAHK